MKSNHADTNLVHLTTRVLPDRFGDWSEAKWERWITAFAANFDVQYSRDIIVTLAFPESESTNTKAQIAKEA